MKNVNVKEYGARKAKQDGPQSGIDYIVDLSVCVSGSMTRDMLSTICAEYETEDVETAVGCWLEVKKENRQWSPAYSRAVHSGFHDHRRNNS